MRMMMRVKRMRMVMRMKRMIRMRMMKIIPMLMLMMMMMTMMMIKMMLELTPVGEEGVCTLPRQCLGERTVAGPCTIFKSVCCMEILTCNNTISQTVGRFTNPGYPDREVEALATCSLSVIIRPETCVLRLVVRQLQLRAGEEGRCVR